MNKETPTSKTSLFVRDLREKLQRTHPVSLQRGAINLNDATGEVEVMQDCASNPQSIEMDIASFRSIWELGFNAATSIRQDETSEQSNEKLAAACENYAEWITVPLSACDVLRRAAEILRAGSTSRDADDANRYRYLKSHLGLGWGVKLAGADPHGFSGPTLLDKALDAARGAVEPKCTEAMLDEAHRLATAEQPIFDSIPIGMPRELSPSEAASFDKTLVRSPRRVGPADRFATRFEELAALPHNWDSYGGVPPLGNCLAKARQLAQLLPAGHWDIVPGSDGSVQIEQHQGGLDIELHISNAENGTVLPSNETDR